VDSFGVPDAVEPVVGWRYWRVGSHGHLTSIGPGKQEWMPGRAFAAHCRHERLDPDDERWRLVDGSWWRPHKSPDESCPCGIYAARDLRSLRSRVLFGMRFCVVGEVSLWGKVIPGSRGFRAEFAYPKRLFVIRGAIGNEQRTIGALKAYRVPVETIAYNRAVFSPALAVTEILSRLRTPPAPRPVPDGRGADPARDAPGGEPDT
jgi:hypothetical protein